MSHYYADLHIHIGRGEGGEVVKVTGSKRLTFARIMEEANERKGLHLVGIIDAHSPPVQREIEREIATGRMQELSSGGIRFRASVVLLGCEVEVKPDASPPFHILLFFPTLSSMKEFSNWMSTRVRNLQLSTQRLYARPTDVQKVAKSLQGLIIPAHVFTPYKGVYGSASRLSEVLDPSCIDAVELGLSSDTWMAAQVSELSRYPFLSNSDAHSLAKIGREFNDLQMEEANFAEFSLALKGEKGRKIAANYGMHPELGKYHVTFCQACEQEFSPEPAQRFCPHCGSADWVFGVRDRIARLAQIPGCAREIPERPPYRYHIPLEFFPKVGKKRLERLLTECGPEMALLHDMPLSQLADRCGAALADAFGSLRRQELDFLPGGGGRYGKVLFSPQR